VAHVVAVEHGTTRGCCREAKRDDEPPPPRPQCVSRTVRTEFSGPLARASSFGQRVRRGRRQPWVDT
jgi:hypothetical protein